MKLNSTKFNSDWDDKTLSELGTFARGKSRHRPRNDPALYVSGQYPLVQTGDVTAATFRITRHSATYNDFGLAQSKLWPEGTLCITIAANIAETALLGYPMCFPDSVVGFTADPDETSEVFMHYVFTYIRKAIQNSVTGSIQDNINIEYLTNLRFKIPSPDEQRRLANVLSTLDGKIDLNNRINAELEALAKTIYDYWFVQFDFPDAKGRPYKSNGGAMVWNDTLKREIPAGWEAAKLSSWIAKTKTGEWGGSELSGHYEMQVVCIRGADISALNGNGELNAPTRYISSSKSGKFLAPNDIVIEISGGSPTQSTGRAALISSEVSERFDFPLVCSNFCKAMTLKEPRRAYEFLQLWSALYSGKVFFGWEGKTSGIKNLQFDAFIEHHSVSVAPAKVSCEFQNISRSLEKRKQNGLRENRELTQLRDWLLPLLMNGQVRVV